MADGACRWCGDAGGCQNVRFYEDCVFVLPCNNSRGYMVSGSPRAQDIDSTACNPADKVSSYEIVTDYTGYAIVHYICGLISTALKTPGRDAVPLNLEVVFYDSNSSQVDPDYNISVPQNIALDSAKVNDLFAFWGGYEIVGQIVDDKRWIINGRTMYVGFRWNSTCPGLWFEELTDPVVPSNPPPYKRQAMNTGFVARTAVFSRNSSSEPWVPGTASGIAPLSIELLSQTVCGDGLVMPPEQCDSGLLCIMSNCSCPFNYEADAFSMTATAGLVGCQCPTANELHPHWFIDPPTMNVTRAPGSSQLELYVYLPQTKPSRWAPVVELANLNGTVDNSMFKWDMVHQPCYYDAAITLDLQDLISNYDFYTLELEDFYELNFGVAVSWMERVPLGPDPYDPSMFQPLNRTMTAKLTIGLLIQRVLTVNSTIWVLDDGLIWAYVSKSFLFMNEAGEMWVDLEIVTRTLSENITINSHTFNAATLAPSNKAILTMSNLSLVWTDAADPRYQRWTFRVALNYSVCTTEWYDNFTLSYDLVNTTTENLNPRRRLMFLTIGKMEEWCSVDGSQVEFDALEGTQKTYLDSELLRPATRFWANNTVYVAVEVVGQYGLLIENVTVVTSRLVGTGLVAGSVLIYNATQLLNPDWQFDEYTGTAPCIGNTGCYSFFLPALQVHYNRPITIYTTVFFTAEGMKRSVTLQETHTLSRFSAIPRTEPSPISDPWTSKVNVDDAGINYRLSAPFLVAVAVIVVVPIVCLAVIIWITRSRLRA
jgi:hypothetical protein